MAWDARMHMYWQQLMPAHTTVHGCQSWIRATEEVLPGFNAGQFSHQVVSSSSQSGSSGRGREGKERKNRI